MSLFNSHNISVYLSAWPNYGTCPTILHWKEACLCYFNHQNVWQKEFYSLGNLPRTRLLFPDVKEAISERCDQ